MGRMVRGDHIDAAFIDRRPQGVLIVHSFDGWIAFDVGSVSSVGSVVEEEVMDAGFGRDAFLLKIARGEKRKFPCRRDVQDVQSGVMSSCEFYREARRTVARVGGTDPRVLGEWDGVSVGCMSSSFVGQDGSRGDGFDQADTKDWGRRSR